MNANTLKNYYSQDYFVAVPDRLLDIMVKGLRITPFSYYCEITEDIINNEKIYASLPSFTKADCLSLLGIKRQQYIAIINQCRSSNLFFLKFEEWSHHLPIKPVELPEAWWVVQAGQITKMAYRYAFFLRNIPQIRSLIQVLNSLDHQITMWYIVYITKNLFDYINI